GILALLGVVACPITSGDTAFRSARLAIADALKFNQAKFRNRFIIAIPLFAIGVALCFIDFAIIWRYFAWANQTLAMVMLWAAASYLMKNKSFHYICSIPAAFMTAVTVTYIIIAPEGLKLSDSIGYPVGIITAIAAFIFFLYKDMQNKKKASGKKVQAA
ncbi:MAG: Carbon starvation protein, partial [Clostridia bacterium]|nr:Carbon starvation protein [Clostridia bacterium]